MASEVERVFLEGRPLDDVDYRREGPALKRRRREPRSETSLPSVFEASKALLMANETDLLASPCGTPKYSVPPTNTPFAGAFCKRVFVLRDSCIADALANDLGGALDLRPERETSVDVPRDTPKVGM